MFKKTKTTHQQISLADGNFASLTYNANIVKEMIITGLVQEDLIDIELANHILQSYAIVVRKKGWFGGIIDFFSKRRLEPFGYSLVKICDVEITTEEEKETKDEQQSGLTVIPFPGAESSNTTTNETDNSTESNPEEEGNPD